MKTLAFALTALLLATLAPIAPAKDADAKQPAFLPQEDGTILVEVTSAKDALENALRKQTVLAQQLQDATEAWNAADDSEKAGLLAEVQRLQSNLRTHNAMLALMLNPDGIPQYRYDGASNLVSVSLGTPEEVFLRLMAKRGLLEKALEQSGDNAETRSAVTAQLGLLKGLLYAIYGISSDRNYSFNAQNGILYLKSTEQEAKALQQKLSERL